jgi:hypothetical protein
MSKNKQIDGYYWDGVEETTLFKDEDGEIIKETGNSNNTFTDTLVLSPDLLTPESKQEAIEDLVNRLQLIVEDLRKLGGI